MNYEQRYKEVLKAVKELQEANQSDNCIQNWVEEKFPELKESEDEKIRKVLIDYFNRYKEQEECGINTFYGIPTDDILAWLEKQGEPTDINPSEFDLRLNKLLKQFETLPKEELTNSLSFYLNVVQNNGTYKYDEKQDEQKVNYTALAETGNGEINALVTRELSNSCDYEEKPVGKVESKFHSGEWITNGDYTWKIIDVKPLDYILQSQDGNIVDDTISHVDEQFNLWTIQDAKDGDVLIDKNYMGESPFIFKETKPSNIKTDVPNPLTVFGYCGIGGAGFTKSSGWGDTANCIYYPATKEQRELLFQKIKESGYEWNNEKKGLLEIEEELTDFEKSLKHIMIETLECGDTRNLKADAEMLLRLAQEPKEWSEEDESMYTRTLGILGKCYMGQLPTKVEEELKWFKSIKDKVQLKPTEWSDEDEDMVRYIGNAITCKESAKYLEEKGIDMIKAHRWLESFKERYIWKPTKEQMHFSNWLANVKLGDSVVE